MRLNTPNVYVAQFSADGSRIVTTNVDQKVRLCDAHTGDELVAFSGYHFNPHAVSIAPDGTRVMVSAGRDALIFNAEVRKEALVLSEGGASVKFVVPSPDGKRILTGDDRHKARLWDSDTGELCVSWDTHHTGTQFQAAFSPDGARVLTWSGAAWADANYDLKDPDDTTARIWLAESGDELAVLRVKTGDVRHAAFDVEGKRVVTASYREVTYDAEADGAAQVWCAERGTQLACIESGPTDTAVFTRNGGQVMTVSGQGDTVRVWDAETGVELPDSCAESRVTKTEARSLNGKIGATWSREGSVARLFDVESSRTIAELPTGSEIRSVAFSPDSARVLSVSTFGPVRVWDARGGGLLASLETHSQVLCGAFTPDGNRVISGDFDGKVHVWDVSRTVPIAYDRAYLLAAALGQGFGRRAEAEERDLLLSDVGDDLYELALSQLGQLSQVEANTLRQTVDGIASSIRKRLHRNCYMLPDGAMATVPPSPP